MKQKEIEVYCDGGARGNPGPAASAFLVTTSSGKIIHKAGEFIGKATNNEAEYQAVKLAHEWLAKNMSSTTSTKTIFFIDSELVVKQLKGEYRVKSKELLAYVIKIKTYEKILKGNLVYKHVKRSKNYLADKLVNETLDMHHVEKTET